MAELDKGRFNEDFMINWTTDTGIPFTLANPWDFLTFTDVFINRTYQLNLRKVPYRENAQETTIVDLGANVGYFSLYAAHECRKAGQAYHIHAFEAMPATFNTLTDRMSKAGIPITCHYGAVGKIDGIAYMTGCENHAVSFLVEKDSGHQMVEVPYRDLNLILPDKVDILKCDIEGSEFDLVSNYPDLLRRTDLVYMEVHHRIGDADKLRQQMKDYGFDLHTITLYAGDCTTEVFTRS